MLLPPTIVGPITQISPVVVVLGALDGATIQLLGNGTPIGNPTIATGISTIISISGIALVPGMLIGAVQSLGGVTSSPSIFIETVNGLPSKLPSVVFLSNKITPCSDWVLLGGLIPGATVDVFLNGNRIGSRVARGKTASIPIEMSPSPSPGDFLEASQLAYHPQNGVLVSSPTVVSAPIQALGTDQINPPTIQPPLECDMAVLVTGTMEGASLVLKQDTQDFAYAVMGPAMLALLERPARVGEPFAAMQSFRQCRISSGFSNPAVVARKIEKLPTPVIVGPMCPNAALIRVRNLRIGATVTIYAHKMTPTGAGAGLLLGSVRAWAMDCDIALPLHWSNHPQLTNTPGDLIIKLWQENCGKMSDPASLSIEPLPGSLGQPEIQPMPVECARVMIAKGVTPGAYVQLKSDQADWPKLGGPFLITNPRMAFTLNRPLRAGEFVGVMQIGCGVDATSNLVQVQPLSGLPAVSVVSPIRIPHGQVSLRNLIIGARVHVSVWGITQLSFDAEDTEMTVTLGGLTRGMTVSAVQVLCGKTSSKSNEAEVLPGRMNIQQAPNPIIRNRPTSITISAVDGDTGELVHGTVSVGTTIVGSTNVAFSYTFPQGANPTLVVDADGYQMVSESWYLIDPLPPPPPKLTLSIQNQAMGFFLIESIEWSMYRQEPDDSLTWIASRPGNPISFELSSPGLYQIYPTVMVTDLVNGGTVPATVETAFVTGIGVPMLPINWNNTAMTHSFRLVTRMQTVVGGGGIIQIPYPFVQWP